MASLLAISFILIPLFRDGMFMDGVLYSAVASNLAKLLVVVGAGDFVAVLVLFPLEVLVALEVVVADGLFAELVG